MSALFALFCAAAVSSSPEVTLIDFRSDGCGPCRAMDPIVHEMKDAGMPIRIVSVDKEPALAQQFRVGPIPCFVVVANGQEVSRHVGKATRGQLENMLRAGQAAGAPPQEQARERAPGTSAPIQLVNDSANSKPSLRGMPRGGANQSQSLAGQSQVEPMIELEKPRIAKPMMKEVDRRSPLPDDSAKPLNLAGQSSANKDSAIPTSLRDELLQSSVRLILHDDKGRATGSGTVIDCREGEALILTCGHIFREWSSERSRVSVDFFDDSAERGVPARVVKYDLKSDVALIAISTRRQLRVAKVASPRTKPQSGETVLATGCEHGADVLPFPTRITKIDRYKGPPNLCIAGQPVQGRSGGGLFNSQGLVIGVCNAADAEDNEGLYAALGAIHQLLDESKLEFVYRDDAPVPAFQREFERQLSHEPPGMPNAMSLASRDDRLRNEQAITTMDRQPTPLQFPAPGTNSFPPNTNLNQPVPNPAAASATGNEVVLIFRDEKTPSAQGRVVHLRNISPDLMARLEQEEKQQLSRMPLASPMPPNGQLPAANPRPAAVPNANLLPSNGGLRRDTSAAPVSFNR